MTRRGARSPANPRAPDVPSGPRGDTSAGGPGSAAPAGQRRYSSGPDDDRAGSLGEGMRRVALGGFAALATCRAYWPSELDPNQASGSGLAWTLALMAMAGLAVAGALVEGRFRFRWSWTDAAVVALVLLVGLSSTHGLDRRLAINLAWEWAGLGIAYVLARNLPRSPGESRVLAGALVASAVAVSAYGLYQAKVEIPQLQERFRRYPAQVMLEAKVPADPQRMRVFADRVLGSNEVFATFGLANSLAGFLVGPLVLVLALVIRNLGDRDAPGSRWLAIGLALPPLLCLLTCLILTKSRSAFIGLLIGCLLVLWQERGRLRPRLLVGSGLAGLAVIVALGTAAWAAGRLDREVLTQSTLSMRYRWEYWQGTWKMLTAASPGADSGTFWTGVGPGNFAFHYLLHKLPQSSEEIQDPHDLFLDVWATAGFWALLALLAALGLALWNLLGGAALRRRAAGSSPERRQRPTDVPRETTPGVSAKSLAPAGGRLGWLTRSAGLGLVAVFIVGQMNLFEGDLLIRWLILTASWLCAVLLGQALWRRTPVPAPVLGAAVVACVVNLLAAGGIGMPAVALALWLLVALGLNLREDRACARLREYDGRLPAFALALVWSALAGSYFGAIVPYWRSEAALVRADVALAHRPPELEQAQSAYDAAKDADRYAARPWLGDAYLQLLIWESRGSKADDLRWKKIPALLLKAASAPRNPDAWSLHSQRALVIRDLLAKVGPTLPPREIIALKASIVEATRTASRLHPTNPALHARLAEASAEISMFHDAAAEAREALRLDEILASHRHRDKQLSPAQRAALLEKLPEWTEQAERFKLQLR